MTIHTLYTKLVHLGSTNTPLYSPLSPLSPHQFSELLATESFLRPFPQTRRRRRRRRRQWRTVGHSPSNPRPSPCSSLAPLVRLSQTRAPLSPLTTSPLKTEQSRAHLFSPLVPDELPAPSKLPSDVQKVATLAPPLRTWSPTRMGEGDARAERALVAPLIPDHAGDRH
jgi:hypothetical protein